MGRKKIGNPNRSNSCAVAVLYPDRDRPALETHFAALGSEDLYHRFCGATKPAGVTRFLDQLNLTAIPWYGIFKPRFGLAAVCQLARCGFNLEAALTVLPAFRRQGLATALLGRSASYARARGFRALLIHSSMDNTPMLSLARRFGMTIEILKGEVDGRLTLGVGASRPASSARGGAASLAGIPRVSAS
jgi:GNAT superfamily N-acetyltransferase